MNLTLVSKQIATLAPDDTGVKLFTEVAGSWADGEHRIGEKKRIYLEYTSDQDLTNFNFFIDLFAHPFEGTPVNTAKPYYYFGCQYLPTSGVEYNCTLQSQGGDPTGTLIVLKNWKVLLIPDGAFSFQIIIDFFMQADELGNLNINIPNHLKFLTSWYWNPPREIAPDNSNLTNDIYTGVCPDNSNIVYTNDQHSPRVYFYCESTDLPFPGVQHYRTEKFIDFGAGFYFKNKYNADPWFTNTHFRVLRNGIEYPNLASYMDQDVQIRANTDSALNPVSHFFVWLIRTDTNDNSVDMIQNYEADFQWIKASNLSTGDISAPMTDPDEITPQQWEGTFKLKALTYGAKYRLIGIAYSNVIGQPYRVNSFISGEFTCDALPQYEGNGFNVKTRLDDYNLEFRGNDLQCVVEERMRSRLKLYFPFNKWKNDIFSRLGLVVGNDIRRYLTTIRCEIFEEYFDTVYGLGVIKNVFYDKVINRVGPSSYTSVEGMTADFSNTWAEFAFVWRNRFEDNIPCLATYVNGNLTLPQMATMDWGGKTIKIRWTLSFIYDNYTIPFQDDIVFNQQIRVKDYEGMSVQYYDQEANDFEELSNICNDEEVCFGGILDHPLNPLNPRLIVNIKPLDGTVDQIEEAETWPGNQFDQLSTPKIVNEDEFFSSIGSEPAAALFCVDGSELLVNSQYEISAIAKKFVETGRRITEEESLRITEESDKRIIEP